MTKKLHIISFDIPAPPNYGGVIDVYWKIYTLHSLGIKVFLHCFYDKRKPVEELEGMCEKVYYYPRKKGILSFPIFYPYMAFSRRASDLLTNISNEDAPIFIEGLQCCFQIEALRKITKQKIAVRMHNNEWEYYANLGKSEGNLWKKAYFYWESFLLHRFEKRLRFADEIFAISPADQTYFSEKYSHVSYLPAFHPHQQVVSLLGKGDFLLYQGNLSVVENHQAALFIISEIASKINFPLVIAGANPRPSLIDCVQKYPHIRLITNPSTSEMAQWVQAAHIHLLPTFQATGIKLKLLNALFEGRFVLTNPEMIEDTGLASLVSICHNSSEFIAEIEEKMQHPFPQWEIDKRIAIFSQTFDNFSNAQQLLDKL